MIDSPISDGRAVSFGPFRLFPEQQLLLEDEAPVRLGSRAFEILTALVERPGEVVGKTELIERVWPNTFIDENTLRVHVAGLRKALGDGQPGRRYLASVPGRGYRFVAPVDLTKSAGPVIRSIEAPPSNNLPISKSRVVGRAGAINALCNQLPRQRLATVVGAGGIGKTTVALNVAETLLSSYPDGVRFVDLAPVEDPQFLSTTIGTALGLAIPPENAIIGLLEFLSGKRMLIVLDSCEHVVDASACLVEQLLAGAPGVNVLATSREPLRVGGERVHRLLPLEVPADPSGLTAAEALSYSAVQLFVERAAAILDGFELSDADAPIVSDICRKLGGIALAIELAAARVDAFGVQQLAVLLDDRFRILKQGKRTALRRHQSLAAALDWSYEFLPEIERAVLCRLSVFAAAFTLDAAIAMAGDDDTDVVETLANLVAKSLVSADVGGPVVLYRLLETTRAYALEKLSNTGEFGKYARRHAQHQIDWFKGVETNWQARSNAEWLVEYGRRIDDLRAALNWALSPDGDLSIAVSLHAAWLKGVEDSWNTRTNDERLVEYGQRIHDLRAALNWALSKKDDLSLATGLPPASSTLWPALAPTGKSWEEIERTLASRMSESTVTARVLGGALGLIKGAHPSIGRAFTEALAIAEKTGDVDGRIEALLGLSCHNLYAGNYREAAAAAERCCAIDGESDDVSHPLMGAGVAAHAFFCLGDFVNAQRSIDAILNRDHPSRQYWFAGYRQGAQCALANLQWLQGFPDRAIRSAERAIEQSEASEEPIIRVDALAQAACPIALQRGDFTAADRWTSTLLDLTSKNALPVWNVTGLCLKGMLLVSRGDPSGLAVLESALAWLHSANFVFLRMMPTAAFAQGLAEAGKTAKARAVIDEALEQAKHNEEYWCMAELLRIKGEILRLDAVPSVRKSEGCFLEALDWARRQEALSWELRATTSLAKLWQHERKKGDAMQLLSSVYDRFTEGFGTADLKAARALIDDLRASQEESTK